MKKLFVAILALYTATTLSAVFNTAKDEAKESAQHAKNALDIGATNAQANAYNTAENLKDKASNTWEATKNKTSNAWEATKDKAENAWEYVKDKAENTGEYVQDKAGNAAQATGNVFQRFGNWLYNSIWLPVKNAFSANKTQTAQTKEVTVTYNPNK